MQYREPRPPLPRPSYTPRELQENREFQLAMSRNHRWCQAVGEYGSYVELGAGQFYCTNPTHDHSSPVRTLLGPTREIILRNTIPPSKGSRIKPAEPEPEETEDEDE